MRSVVCLFDILALPEHSVRPGGRSSFLAGIPYVGARIVFVRGRETNLPLLVADKHFSLVSLKVKLVVLLKILQIVIS